MKRSLAFRLLVSALAVLALLIASPATGAQAASSQNGVIFVHGFIGSGAQFESQKMRFTSNGYPSADVAVLEYDSTFATETRNQVAAKLDRLIDFIKARTGRPKVDLLGHSLGTQVSQDYLNSSPARAAKVAHYVNIDGREAAAPPGGVPTLAIWAGRGDPGREVVGAQNVTIPNQTHVQSATSAESFAEFFEFFTGQAPANEQIVRESGRITIQGRAVNFPQNRGLDGATLEIWELNSATGRRRTASPVARIAIGASGRWGPVTVDAGKHYEFALLRVGFPPHHIYREPFVRSDHLVRLLESDALAALAEKSDNHVAMVIIRYKELWGDQGAQNDRLRINGTLVCNPATCPVEKQVNGLFAFDEGSDQQTDLSAPHPAFSAIPFITGVDVFIPADIPPTGQVSVQLRSRGVGPVRTLNLPNFASTRHRISLQLHDFDQTSPAGQAR
jgi:pimeloyl-ACP methyl ester carboxylesterase